jgi:hypothetical protein
MARSRNIKPGFFTNDKLVELPFETRLLFIGLWTLADKAGRLANRPKKIKMELFPADKLDVEPMLGALESAGFIDCYTVDGVACIKVNNWTKHQSPHHTERASTLPPRLMDGDLTVKSPEVHASITVEIPLIPDSGFLIPDSSVLRTGGESPPANMPDQEPSTAKDRVWAFGPVLIGGSAQVAKTLLGKLVKAHGETVVDEVLTACAVQKPGEPKAWIVAACLQRAVSAGRTGDRKPEGFEDPRPRWAVGAGFANRFEAASAGCWQHNAKAFRDGRKSA